MYISESIELNLHNIDFIHILPLWANIPIYGDVVSVLRPINVSTEAGVVRISKEFYDVSVLISGLNVSGLDWKVSSTSLNSEHMKSL